MKDGVGLKIDDRLHRADFVAGKRLACLVFLPVRMAPAEQCPELARGAACPRAARASSVAARTSCRAWGWLSPSCRPPRMIPPRGHAAPWQNEPQLHQARARDPQAGRDPPATERRSALICYCQPARTQAAAQLAADRRPPAPHPGNRRPRRLPTRCRWLAAIHSQGEQPYPPDLGATTGPAPTSHQRAERRLDVLSASTAVTDRDHAGQPGQEAQAA